MRPLVILPGWGHGRESWGPLVARLAPREVRILELPGFGSEPLVSGDWGVPEYAEWVRERLAPLSAQGFDLLGHSFGGRIAALVASERIQGLATLVLYGAPLLRRPSATMRLKIAMAKLLKPFIPTALRSRGNPELARAQLRGMGAIFRNTVGFDQTSTLPRITASTLLVWGARDEAVPLTIAHEAQGLIPGSELSILPGLGHNAHIENPMLFCGIVSKFLDSHEHTPPLR